MTCEHPFDDYVLVAVVVRPIGVAPEVPVAGWMYCPSCDYQATWALKGQEVSDEEIGPWDDRYRDRSQMRLVPPEELGQ